MLSTRRAFVRASVLGVSGVLAGCSGGRDPDSGPDSADDTAPRTSPPSSRTAARPTREMTDEAAAQTTSGRGEPPAVEFVHRSPALGSGVGDAGPRYSARLFGRERELRAAIDRSSVREERPARVFDRVDRFVAATDYRSSAILAVEARLPSPGYGLGFAFCSRWGVPHAVVRTRKRDREGSDPATSTLLIRLSARVSSSLAVTVADVVGARDAVRSSVTFRPPSELLYETANYAPIESLPAHSGALIDSRPDAERLVPADHPAREFLGATDFERSYLLAVGTAIRNGGGYVWPGAVARSGDRVAAQVWNHGFTGGPSAEFPRSMFARIPGEAPDRGTATIRVIGDGDARTVGLSSDPGDWPASGDTSK